MQLRDLARRFGDPIAGVVLAVAWVVEASIFFSTPRLGLAAAAGCAGGLAIALRRRLPLVAIAVALATFEVMAHVDSSYAHNGVCPLVMLVLSLYSLGAHTRGLEAALAPVGVGTAIALLDVQDGDYTVAGIFFFTVLCGLPWGTGLAIRLRIDRVRDLEVHNAALREEATRAVADERARIARELHDVVSHGIAVTVLQARGGAKLVGRDDDAVRRALASIEQTNTAALADMRRLLALLRRADGSDGRDAPQPGLDRLDHLVEQVRGSGLPVDLQVSGEPLPVPPGLDLSAYRIVQEALTNVLKHGGPDARAQVCVRYGLDDLEVQVTNTGRTATTQANGGHGLIGIRERVSVAGGSVDVGPRPGGYAVRARLPYLVAT